MKLIVGIDPGITAAVAFIDVESDYYKTISRRNFSFSEICEAVAEEGDPIIIASDTQHAPQLLKRIASTFGCRLFLPNRDMMVGEKKFLTEKMNYRNDHERDALASALHAKQEFISLFEKIDYHLDRKEMKNLSGDVKELLVKGEAANIEHAVKMLAAETRKETRVVSKIIESKKVLELREKIRQLEKGKSILEEYARHLKEENRLLRNELETATGTKQKDTKLHILEEKISDMRRENERLRNQAEEYREIINLKDSEIVYPFKEGASLEDKVVIADKRVNIKALEKHKPKAIISDQIFETDIPIIPKEKINIQTRGNFLIVDKKDLENAMQESFFAWLRNYRERYAAQT